MAKNERALPCVLPVVVLGSAVFSCSRTDLDVWPLDQNSARNGRRANSDAAFHPDRAAVDSPAADAASSLCGGDEAAIAPVLRGPEPSADLFDASAARDAAGGGDLDAGDLDADAGDLSSEPSDPPTCELLAPLAVKGVLTSRRTKQVLYDRHRRFVVLRAAPELPADAMSGDDVLLVHLPSGEITVIASDVTGVEPLGEDALLVRTPALPGGNAVPYELSAVPFDGGGLRPLASAVCEHVTMPDGSRVYVLHDCYHSKGTLEVVDTATGAVNRLGMDVVQRSMAVSPGSCWMAFVVAASADPTVDSLSGIIHVVDRTDNQYAVAAPASAQAPAFFSDRRMFFSTGSTFFGGGDVHVHQPGSGDASTPVARNRMLGFHGYELSPDGERLLVAREIAHDQVGLSANDLLLARTDGTGETLIATDLAMFQWNQLGPRVFGFNFDGSRIVYAESSYALASVDPKGQTRAALPAHGVFWSLSPATDEIVAREDELPPDTGSQVIVASASTGAYRYGFEAKDRIGAVAFLPDGRGLVFAVRTPHATRLHFSSTRAADSTVLAEWNESKLQMAQRPRYAGPSDITELEQYPMDPTACFLIADTDLAPGPGTRLLMLPR